MFRYFPSSTLKHRIQTKIQHITINHQPFSTDRKTTTSHSIRQFVKNIGYLLGAGVTVSLVYAAYESMIRVPICPNFNRKQDINITNVLSCTALVQNTTKQCKGQISMKKIGAITGVNYKLVQAKSENSNVSSRVLVNDEEISQKNLFDVDYMPEYVETLADLLMKLDESHLIKLLSNTIGYYVFLCPECHSSLTQQMISCTYYLHNAGLKQNAVNTSDIENVKSSLTGDDIDQKNNTN
ncbi:unnamed protein product [Rotaria socialis]|uniref:Uncharacterized protein n=2 Tax=Rotaria socialis TaxID=392032 RepID=A0A817R125_9BILA|nr:unnamed protein product [Rotaria socialis]CAF3604066.1 unnamed protein product [Rotaria socialis]CAF4235810.1 unnamed protein product [Rotaria socialis]